MSQLRDREIMQLVSEGYKAKEISKELSISVRSVEKRLELLKCAHEAKNLPHLVAIAIKNKLIKF